MIVYGVCFRNYADPVVKVLCISRKIADRELKRIIEEDRKFTGEKRLLAFEILKFEVVEE